MVKQVASLDACFQALADPTRRHMIEALARGEQTVGDLAGPHAMSLVAIHKHVRVLEDAGLVVTEKRGRRRHCRLVGHPMKEAVQWMRRYRAFWDQRLDALGDVLDEMNEEEP